LSSRGIKLSQTEAKAGDIIVVDSNYPRQHIGICINDGCTKVKSNSSSRAAFKWESGPTFEGIYGNAMPEFYRLIK
jgi:hypothetical protein